MHTSKKSHTFANNSILALLLFLLFVGSQANDSMDLDKQFAKNSNDVSLKLLHAIEASKPHENIIYSPFSILISLTMLRMGTVGKTAEELDKGLGLVSDRATVAEIFHILLSGYEDSKILKIANRIYVMQGYTIKREFNELVSKKFFSSAEEIDFQNNVAAANTMNAWVESKTNNLIKDVIPSSALSQDTRMVLLNAIYFKGEWKHKFPEHATRDEDFYLNDSDTVKVKMMNIKERFKYADLPELDAKALEMPYRDSDLSMLIILPNSRTGLRSLEDNLLNVSLSDIVGRMHSDQVIVKLPKFKHEFSIELNEPLKKMGLSHMFAGGDFTNLLESSEGLRVSAVIHKAFIEVNEEGTEAAAATVAITRKKRSLGFISIREFSVKHPFFYVIYHAKSIPTDGRDVPTQKSTIPFFMGSVSRFDNVMAAEPDAIMHEEL